MNNRSSAGEGLKKTGKKLFYGGAPRGGPIFYARGEGAHVRHTVVATLSLNLKTCRKVKKSHTLKVD
jgi:hypothetical protein